MRGFEIDYQVCFCVRAKNDLLFVCGPKYFVFSVEIDRGGFCAGGPN